MSQQIRNQLNSTEYVTEDGFKSWDLAQDIVDNYPIATSIQTDKVYMQNGAVWDSYGEQLLRSELWHILGNTSNQTRINETVDAIKHLSRMPRDKLLGLEPHKVVVENGVVDMLADDPADRFDLESNGRGTFTRVPVRYESDATVPEAFNEFLFDILHPEDVSIMWELIGYTLYRGYPFQKAFMMVGEGANGKSTLLRAMREFIGGENVSAVELQDLADSRFAAAKLDGMLANMAPDISARELEHTGTFKALTGGDTIQAERKYEEPYEFRNHATLIFSANRAPPAPDDTHAYERRWVYFQFPNTFNKNDNDYKPQSELLKDFRDEHPAMLNQAVEAFQDLWERGGFQETVLMKEYEGAHDRLTDPAVEYVKDHLERDEGSHVRKSELHKKFQNWARENDRPTQGKRHLETIINNEYAPASGKDPDDGRHSAFFGIRFAESDDKQSRL